jgi:hypothetical protein
MLGFLSRKFFLLRNNLGMFRGLFNFKNLKKIKNNYQFILKTYFLIKILFFFYILDCSFEKILNNLLQLKINFNFYFS